MPYTVTTIPGTSVVVGTLDEARLLVWTLLPGDGPAPDWCASVQIKTIISESGGTVGPLPDGTLIEVEVA